VDGAWANRRSAKAGFSTMMEQKQEFVLSSETVFTSKENCAEKLEAVGLEAALTKLEGAKIDISKFCHDAKAEQKTSIKKRPRYKTSLSRLDLWHAKKR